MPHATFHLNFVIDGSTAVHLHAELYADHLGLPVAGHDEAASDSC